MGRMGFFEFQMQRMFHVIRIINQTERQTARQREGIELSGMERRNMTTEDSGDHLCIYIYIYIHIQRASPAAGSPCSPPAAGVARSPSGCRGHPQPLRAPAAGVTSSQEWKLDILYLAVNTK
jgi:hypothetical protein